MDAALHEYDQDVARDADENRLLGHDVLGYGYEPDDCVIRGVTREFSQSPRPRREAAREHERRICGFPANSLHASFVSL